MRRDHDLTAARPQLDDENPWPGLESFREEEGSFFFGRDAEAVALLEHVLDGPVTVLYGRSGLGKTSLLRAGLFPLLREKQYFARLHALRGETGRGATVATVASVGARRHPGRVARRGTSVRRGFVVGVPAPQGL